MNNQIVYNKLFNKSTKLKSKKIDLMYRENDIDNLWENFRTYRSDLSFVETDKLPNVINELNQIQETINNSEENLLEIIKTYKEIAKEYSEKLIELGLIPEDIAEYNFIGTRIFEAEEQLDVAKELKEKLNIEL